MKELIRFAGYTAATTAMIGVLTGIAEMHVSGTALLSSAIFIVVILPIVIGILMARREKKSTASQ